MRGCGTRQASGPPATPLHPDPKAPCSPQGRPLGSILFCKLLELPRLCLKKTFKYIDEMRKTQTHVLRVTYSTYHYLTTSQSSHCIKLKRKCRSEWEFANPRTPAFLFQVAFHQNVGGSEGHTRANPQCRRMHGPQETPPRHLTHLGAQSREGDTPQHPPPQSADTTLWTECPG